MLLPSFKKSNFHKLLLPLVIFFTSISISYAQPANDLCSNAIPLICGQSLAGTTVGAGDDIALGQAPNCFGATTAGGVWYSFVGTGGSMNINLCGSSNFDNRIGLHTGVCGSLVCVGSSDDDCGLSVNYTFNSTFGTEYLLLIYGFGGGTGTFTVTLNCDCSVDLPANQVICNNSSSTAINFTGGAPGTVFNWTNNTPSIGLPASGSGDIASFTATNATNDPVVATVTVTPSTLGSDLINFNYTGSMQTWTVPAGVTQVTLETWGAQGGPGNVGGNDPGGLGGYAKGDLSVTPGQVLNIYVGGTPTTTAGGWNGGGNGALTFGERGAGGGATDIRLGGTTLNDRVLVGAGGGGSTGVIALAGVGGGLIGGDGGYAGDQGFGGTQIAGGLGSPGNLDCWPGTFGQGGGNTGTSACSGGGGGWYGGGAGSGGGGGSSYIDGVTGGSTTSGIQAGNGLVTISYSYPACIGTPKTFTITVNPTPVGSASPQTICDETASNIALNSTVTGTTYTWSAAIQTTPTGGTITGFSDCASACGTSIAQTLTNTGTTSGVVRYTVTPTANGCAGAPFTVDVTINPTPNAVATPASQTICSANAISTIVLSGAVSGTTYAWTRDNTASATGIAASGSGNISGNLTNTTNAPVTVTFTITPSANSCPGAAITATVLVNPTPDAVATPASQTICSAATISTIVLSGDVSGTTYAWTRDNAVAVTGIAASSSGNISGSLTNTTSAPITVTFTITPTANSCPGAAITATVLVNPTPDAVATPASQTICSANAISTIVLSGAVSGTTYAWTRDNAVAVTGIAASGSGNISGTLTNTTNAPITVTFTITPSANSCPGAAITATVLVNPTPNAVATTPSQTICSGPIATIALSGAVSGTVFNWTRDNMATVTGIAASGSGNIFGSLTNTTSSPVTVTFTIIPTANGCPGAAITATVVINPTPSYTFTSDGVPYSEGDTITACHQDVLALAITSPVTVTYTFTRLSNGNVINTGTTPGSFNFTATNAKEGYYEIGITNSFGCILKDTIYLLVNPLPNPIATATPNPICQGGSLQLGVNGGNNFGFAWSGPNGYTSNVKNPVINGILPSASGVYTVTVTNLNGCSDTSSVSVLVNPTPTAVATPASQTICSAASISTIVLSGAVSGTTYAWTRDNAVAVTGIAASGSGNISGSLTNTTNAPVTVTFTITPTANGCPGAAITATVLVNPTPNAVATPASQTICSATSISTIVLTGAVSGTTYAWTRNNTASVTGIAASGSGNISGTLTNTTNAPVTVTFTIIPTANGCPGAAITATVLVNPTPTAVATPATQTICSETLITTITLSGPVIGTTFTWTRNNTATVTGIAASGSGNNIFGALTNTTSAPITVTFTITPSANGCIGTTTTATVIVNPKPIGTISIAPNPACVGSTVQLSASGGSTYSWSGPLGWTSSAQNPTILLTTHLQAGKYFVTVSNTYGCSVVLSSQLSVNYPPIATASYELSTACVGSNLQLHGTGAGSYAWSGPNGFTSNQQNPQIPNVTVANSGLYILVVTSPNGCTATTTLNITINNPPALSANPTLTQTCEGSKIQLFASGTGSFVWNGPATYTSTDQNPVIQNIPIHMSGIYTVNLTASTGCVSTASVTVKVYDQIHAIATASEDTICQGQSLQLHAEGGSTYLWNGPNGFNSTESDPRIDNITPAASGKYYVYISNEGGCFGYAELTIVVKPSAKSFAYATPNPVNENSPVQFIASSNGVAYSWSGPLGFTSNQQNPFIKKVTRYMAGVYTVTITNENGCPSIVKVILRVLYTNKGGNTIDGDDDGLTTRSEATGTVYPNPTNDLLYFDTQSSEAIEYVIYDVNGKMQVVQKTTSDRYISTSNLASGIYQIRWKSKDSEQWIVSKFVKIK